MITVREKKYHNVTQYFDKGCGVHFNNFRVGDAGYIYGWTLCIGDKHYKGFTTDEFKQTLNKIIKEYNLHVYSENKKDVMVIFIDNVLKVYGFFKDVISDYFPKDNLDKINSVFIYDVFEFRDISVWNDELHGAVEIADYAQFLINEVFQNKYDKYFYSSPQQMSRRWLKKYVGKDKTASKLFPRQWKEYLYYREAVFGGINYAIPGIYEHYLKFDLCSAYIFCMLIKKHCMSEKEALANPSRYAVYKDKPFIGRFKITYKNYRPGIQCYKDVDRQDIPESGKVHILLSDIDLANFCKVCDVEEIKCGSLLLYKRDYLPKSNRDFLVDMFLDKQHNKSNEKLYKIIKKMLNSAGYGDSIRDLPSGIAYKKHRDSATTIPEWGIEALAYCKEMILSIGLKAEDWIYTATDSVIIKDIPENRKLVEEFNRKIQQEVKEFCDVFGYDFESLKGLGQFELEDEVDKIRVRGHNSYGYSAGDKFEVKAGGYDYSNVTFGPEYFDLEKLPGGHRTVRLLTDKYSSIEVNGIKLESFGSYYEISGDDEDAENLTKAMMIYGALKKIKQNKK